MLTTWGNSTGKSGPSLELNFVGQSIAGALDPRITFSRASTATRVNSAGLIETVATNAPRFDYDPVTLQPKGLLIEEQRTNLLTYSEQFDNAAWGKSTNTTVTANQNISPDGTLSADKITPTAATSGTIQVYSTLSKSSSAIAYTGSFYVKAPAGYYFHLFVDASTTSNAGRIIFNTSDWSITSSTNFGTFTGAVGTVTAVGNGWYRISCSVTSGTETSIRVNLYLSNAINSVNWTPTLDNYFYIWGAQLEVGSFPTSYIPTTTSQVTRSADSASMTGANFSSWYRADEGTGYVEMSGANSSNTYGAVIGNGTAAERIVFGANILRVVASGTDQCSISSGTFTSYTFFKSAGVYKANDFALSVNGGAVATDTSGSVPVPTMLFIGNNGAGAAMNSTIKRIAYYPKRLSNQELQGLTS